MMKSGRKAKYLILEAVILVCLFAAGIGIRLFNMPSEIYGSGSFFNSACVDGWTPVPYTVGTGISQIYLYMLRGIFLIFGNLWQAGIIVQLLLFILGMAVFYFAVRKVTGSVGSLVIVGLMLNLPCFLPITYSYGPQMLYFLLFSVGLYYTHNLVTGCREREEFGILFILQLILTGLYVGLLVYLDIFSVLLVLPVLFIPYYLRKQGILKGAGVALLWVLSAAVCVILCGFVEGMVSGHAVGTVMEQWFYNSWNQIFHKDVAIWNNWHTLLSDRHIWMGIGMLFVYLTTLVYFVIYLVFQRTTRAVRALDVEGLLQNQLEENATAEPEPVVNVEETAVPEAVVNVEETAEPEAVVDAEETAVPEAVVNVEETAVPEAVVDAEETAVPEAVVNVEETVITETAEKPEEVLVRFINNPLPLPKKHVKKALDYAFQPDFEDMDYDIHSFEKDDYDLID